MSSYTLVHETQSQSGSGIILKVRFTPIPRPSETPVAPGGIAAVRVEGFSNDNFDAAFDGGDSWVCRIGNPSLTMEAAGIEPGIDTYSKDQAVIIWKHLRSKGWKVHE